MNYHAFERQCMEELGKMPAVLDVGGGTRFQKKMAKYRELFLDCDYKTMDSSTDYQPDVVGDIHAIPMNDASIDGVICMSVLEHVGDPKKAASEILRILKPGGLAYITVPSICPYHARKGFGGYPDNWRFFEDGLRVLFAEAKDVQIVKQGGWLSAMTNFLPLPGGLKNLFLPLTERIDGLLGSKRATTPFYSIAVRK